MNDKVVKVAVGVVRDYLGRVLIALRPSHKHQGGLWEFPGGKIEPGETCFDALRRELDEELGIRPHDAKPLIKIPFHYFDRSVLLDVQEVRAFDGVPAGKEGQLVRWVPLDELQHFHFPAANQRILKTLMLPRLIAISGSFRNEADFVSRLTLSIERGAGLIQLRLPQMDVARQKQFVDLVLNHSSVPAVVNSGVDRSLWDSFAGLHLRSADLLTLDSRPVSPERWFGASCHSVRELEHAARLGADYVFLSPINPTSSHRDMPAIGWSEFQALAREAGVPVYALGGLTIADLEKAQQYNAYGIAGISAFWSN